jgi:D-alanyl-D-alanine carboxypeptidase
MAGTPRRKGAGRLGPILVLLCGLGLVVTRPGEGEPAARAAATVSTRPVPLAELRAMTAELTRDIREGILARPREFLDLAAKVLDVSPELLTLVDKAHPLDAENAPPDLVRLEAYPALTARSGLTLRRVVMPELLAMASKAAGEGLTLTLSSTYRSYATQREIYAREVEVRGKEAADRESAQPGKSQHQLGTAIDFGSISDEFGSTREGKWLARHAWEFGFSLSYPEGYEAVTGYRYECWHFRYITMDGTRLQREFFGDVQQELLAFLHDHRRELARIVTER